MVDVSSHNDLILQRIAEKRQELLELGLRYDLTSKTVLRCSQELDDLINLIQHSGIQLMNRNRE